LKATRRIAPKTSSWEPRSVRCRERLGVLPKVYYGEAAQTIGRVFAHDALACWTGAVETISTQSSFSIWTHTTDSKPRNR
jgi:hypothetical protein